MEGVRLAVDEKDKVIVPRPDQDSELLNILIAVSHQVDHFHRSSEDTVKTMKIKNLI